MLRSVEWQSFTDISGQPLGPIFKEQEVTWRCDRYVAPETSVKDYHSTLRNIAEDGRSHQLWHSLSSHGSFAFLLQNENHRLMWSTCCGFVLDLASVFCLPLFLCLSLTLCRCLCLCCAYIASINRCRKCQITTLSIAKFIYRRCYKNERRMWNIDAIKLPGEKLEALEEKSARGPHFPPQISHGLARDRTNSLRIVTGKLTAWVMAGSRCKEKG
jgi:hypothetical protein